jgi:hypothetical protein
MIYCTMADDDTEPQLNPPPVPCMVEGCQNGTNFTKRHPGKCADGYCLFWCTKPGCSNLIFGPDKKRECPPETCKFGQIEMYEGLPGTCIFGQRGAIHNCLLGTCRFVCSDRNCINGSKYTLPGKKKCPPYRCRSFLGYGTGEFN